MPVSNLQTVLSKVVTICAIAPAFYVAVLFVLYLLAVAMLTALGLTYNVQVAGLSYMFMASVLSLLLIYLSAITTALWLLPSIGWLLLFSAFARKTPILWAVGVFILLGFLEDFVFGSQYLANWVESRSNPQQYMFFEFTDVVKRLISYDMLFGVVVGSILIAGAISMRRFID
jgi:ABC-2 type transport system permease protein